MTFICSIRVNLKFGLRDFVPNIEDFFITGFVISRFCSIRFTIFAGMKNILRYSGDFVIKVFVISEFHFRLSNTIYRKKWSWKLALLTLTGFLSSNCS